MSFEKKNVKFCVHSTLIRANTASFFSIVFYAPGIEYWGYIVYGVFVQQTFMLTKFICYWDIVFYKYILFFQKCI